MQVFGENPQPEITDRLNAKRSYFYTHLCNLTNGDHSHILITKMKPHSSTKTHFEHFFRHFKLLWIIKHIVTKAQKEKCTERTHLNDPHIFRRLLFLQNPLGEQPTAIL